MIKFLTGDLFESKAEALVNTVNTVGVMGKGIALQFKNLFPNNYKVYKEACKNNALKIGDLLVTVDQNISTGEKIIINFPTKKHWRQPSEYTFIESGLDDLVELIKTKHIKSIAIPPLGSGNGGLQWGRVKVIIKEKLSAINNVTIEVYEPNANIKEHLKKERVKLTPARSMLLYMLYHLVENGELVSEFSSEKICYFLQRFGAEKYFKLDYQPNYYGPYSGKVRHVLNYLNGSYILGYEAKDKRPFDALDLLVDAKNDVESYINQDAELKEIITKTSDFLEGYYSSFGLELLSTVDYISNKHKTNNTVFIQQELASWSNRKKTLFANQKYIKISIQHLENANLLYKSSQVIT